MCANAAAEGYNYTGELWLSATKPSPPCCSGDGEASGGGEGGEGGVEGGDGRGERGGCGGSAHACHGGPLAGRPVAIDLVEVGAEQDSGGGEADEGGAAPDGGGERGEDGGGGGERQWAAGVGAKVESHGGQGSKRHEAQGLAEALVTPPARTGRGR